MLGFKLGMFFVSILFGNANTVSDGISALVISVQEVLMKFDVFPQSVPTTKMPSRTVVILDTPRNKRESAKKSYWKEDLD